MSTQTIPVGRAARPTSTSRGADAGAFAAGAIAAAVAIAVGELVAGVVAGAPSLLISIADLLVDLQPPGAKQLMVDLFGDADKQAVDVMIIAAAVVIAGLLGVAARRSFRTGVIGFGIAGAVAFIGATRQPLTDAPLALLTVVLAVAAGLLALRSLLSLCAPAWATGRATAAGDTPGATMPDWERRSFLIRGGALTAGAVVAGVVGRNLLQGRSAAPITALPDPGTGAGGESLPGIISVPAGAELEVEGITPIVMPNDRFYRIDTAFVVPRVDPRTWTLTIKGMVDKETVLTLDDLAAMPQVEQFVTIACVSNEVGGKYVGNAKWKGVDLRQVLARAGVQEGATQIVGRSVDDFTAGFPTAWAMDPLRTPMIALEMNGVPLPTDHGYPARLIIPGLYGYVSATKWLKEIELTTLEAFDGYWVPLGWAKEAPILTQSRIDVPRRDATLTAGTNAIAGVAWAPDRGISAVEVRIDEGEWQHAELSEPLAPAAWVQWKLAWDATPGSHTIEVRATDGEDEVQTEERTSPAPDGARGHHTVRVTVA